MRNGDVRRLCVALVHNRVSAVRPGTDPQAAALGWQLERSRTSSNAMAALCAGALSGRGATADRWRPSAALEALLTEYAGVQIERALPAREPAPKRSRSERLADAMH